MKKQGLGILNTRFVTQGSDLLVLDLIHKKKIKVESEGDKDNFGFGVRKGKSRTGRQNLQLLRRRG